MTTTEITSDPDAPPEAAAAPRVIPLEQGFWRRLTAADTPHAVAQAWAPLMFGMLDDAEGTAVYLADGPGGRLRAVASWPEARLPGSALAEAAETALQSDRGVVRGGLDEDGQPTGAIVAIAAPLSLDGVVAGAVGLEFAPRTQADLRAAMRRLQWGAAWMRDALRRDQAQAQGRRYEQAVSALHAVVAVAEREDIATAARAAATDLATRFACDRVSIGFRRLGRTRVAAISHSAQFGKRMTVVRDIAAAMDEAVDQRGVILWPDTGADQPMATHRHARFAEANSVGHVFTAPLYAIDRFVGAITFERPESRPFSEDEVQLLEAVATVLAPVLEEKRRNDRYLITKAADVTLAHFGRIVGPGHLGRKAFLIAVAAVSAFFWYARDIDRVAANALVEGAVQRIVSAPFDGFIAEAPVRAGDTVAAGQVLVRLEDRELALERLRHATELQRQRIEFDRATAARDRAEAAVRRSQIDQSEAQIALIDKQLERTRILAPFDGIVTSGDLSQSIGGAVGRGDGLLTVAPEGQYRITLKVDERRIADVAPGQTGALVVTALPDRSFPLVVRKVTPMAEYGDGATTFRVEAELTTPVPGLLSGMDGVAKIDIAERRLIGIWTQPMVDWLRIWAWRWLGLE